MSPDVLIEYKNIPLSFNVKGDKVISDERENHSDAGYMRVLFGPNVPDDILNQMREARPGMIWQKFRFKVTPDKTGEVIKNAQVVDQIDTLVRSGSAIFNKRD